MFLKFGRCSAGSRFSTGKWWTQIIQRKLNLSLRLTAINNWHFSASSILQRQTEKGSTAGETKRSKRKPSPAVKRRHCLLNCTIQQTSKEPGCSPLPTDHQLMDGMFYISSATYYLRSLPSKTLLLPDLLVSFSTAALLFFLFSNNTGKCNIFIKEGTGMWYSPAVYCWKFTLVLSNLWFAKPLGITEKLLQVLWKIAKDHCKPLVIRAKLTIPRLTTLLENF